ncbi:MAG: hypothetical protein AYK19_14050 [Theionarchaea archaeon DG-70-1]|nr:MAG: hypothetical protein AYK19_14050 [Theionarchaea archaeon DG-70-1]
MYQYEFDSLGRITKFINPDQTFLTMEYDDVTNTITVRDENLHKKVYTFSWTATLLSVKEYHDSGYYLTEYQYDQVGNLTKMTDPEQNVTTYLYDSVFGITAVVYPDLTEQHFTYDNIGNVIERIDQNGNSITYMYDAVSRLKEIDYGDTSVSFTYDPAGYRTSVTTSDVTTYYSYDARSRPTQVTYIIDGKPYSVEYSYDPASNITAVTYPDSTTVQYTYSLQDQLESILNYASFTYFPDGNLAQILFSNGVTTDFQYDSRGRMQNIYAYTDADLFDLTYTHDPAGNITEIENNFLTANQEWITSAETYLYDKSDRLISASSGFGTISYTYDSKKRLSVTENGQSTSYVYDYDLLLSAGQQTFTYDSNGNTLTKSSESEWVYHYDNANRLTQVDKDGQIFGQYIYDGDNRRIKKTEWSEDQQDHLTTIYIYSGSSMIYEENTTGTAIHVYGPSGRVVKRTTVNNETNTFYYTTDHLGSTRLVTDSNGTPLSSLRYYPFGKPYQYSGSHEPYLFTGKEKDQTGLYYFGARYYDSETGRFLSRDPYTFLPDDPRIVDNSAEDFTKWLMNPQRFNRFSYAGNNPLKYKDPTGLWWECYDPICIDLLGGEGEDPPPDDPPPEDPPSEDDDDEYDTRQEECQDCDCKDREDIKALRKLKRNVIIGKYSVTFAYALLCGIAAGMLCAGTGPGALFCAALGGAICGIIFGILTDASVDDIVRDIEWTMKQLNCGCAAYCP